ncbi:MAG: LacI family DNA-binding transcriptional regulator [Desulfobacterales bacterium]|jgi:LacI family transcriptional regulator
MNPNQRLKSKSRNITLSDVAAELGVSKATVSLAINGSPLVATKTREKILNKIEELGYVYNRGAAGLSTGQTRIIGLAVHDITNPYFSEVCAAIESVLSQNDRMSFLCNTNESLERQGRFFTTLVEHSADGMILCPAAGTDLASLRPLLNRGIPTVLLTRDVEGAELDFVGNDETLSLRLVTEHLIRRGHRRIVMLGGGQQTSTSQKRRAGYYLALEANGMSVDPALVIDCDTNPQAAEEAIQRILSQNDRPSAIACYTDQVALGAISGLCRLGLKPGKDIAVVGCDDIPEARRAYVRLTTARIQKWVIGQTAANLLIKRISDPELPLQRVVLAPELIIRNSCGSTQS